MASNSLPIIANRPSILSRRCSIRTVSIALPDRWDIDAFYQFGSESRSDRGLATVEGDLAPLLGANLRGSGGIGDGSVESRMWVTCPILKKRVFLCPPASLTLSGFDHGPEGRGPTGWKSPFQAHHQNLPFTDSSLPPLPSHRLLFT